MVDLMRVKRLWDNELRQRRSRSLSAKTGPESMTGGTSATYCEVECSFENIVRLCEPGKCVGLCIGYSVQCPGLCQLPMAGVTSTRTGGARRAYLPARLFDFRSKSGSAVIAVDEKYIRYTQRERRRGNPWLHLKH